MKKYAIVVDPISSGKFFADEFAARGIVCIAVLSGEVPPEFECGYSPSKFEEVIMFDGDLDALAARLTQFAPQCVVLGFETGIDLADALAQKLGLPSNDPATSPARRDKYELHAALQAHGVRSLKQYRAESVEAAKQWLVANGEWSVVVKPTHSASSDNVSICHTLEQALGAVDIILGATNMLGKLNTSALLQEVLDGREWLVDTASCNGKHVVTNISRYLKTVTADANIVYQHAEFLSVSDPGFRDLTRSPFSCKKTQGKVLRRRASVHDQFV